MSDTTELLNSVRDIQEPLPPESSSAALLGLLAVLFIVLAITVLVLTYRRDNKVNRELQQEIHAIRFMPQQKAVLALAALLRRLMHHVHGEQINQLEGQPWLERLNKNFSTDYFTKGRGTIFGDALYATSAEDQPDAKRLCKDIGKLISKTPLQQTAYRDSNQQKPLNTNTSPANVSSPP